MAAFNYSVYEKKYSDMLEDIAKKLDISKSKVLKKIIEEKWEELGLKKEEEK